MLRAKVDKKYTSPLTGPLHLKHKLCFSHPEEEAAMAPIILQSSLPINVSESDTELQRVIFLSKTIRGQIKFMSFYFNCE